MMKLRYVYLATFSGENIDETVFKMNCFKYFNKFTNNTTGTQKKSQNLIIQLLRIIFKIFENKLQG